MADILIGLIFVSTAFLLIIATTQLLMKKAGRLPRALVGAATILLATAWGVYLQNEVRIAAVLPFSNVLVIAQGRLAAQGDFHAIRSLMDDRPHRIRVRTTNARVLGAALVSYGGIAGMELVSDEELLVDTNDVALFRKRIAPTARYADTPLLEVHPLDDDLESVFKYLVGR